MGRDAAEGFIPAEDKEDRKWSRLGNLLQKQAVVLREEMAKAEKSEAEKEHDTKLDIAKGGLDGLEMSFLGAISEQMN